MAQSIGIGTSSPNAKAILDISSINKGVLLPAMTTSQRLGIATPPNGLLVYDTDKDEFYHNTTGGWRPILNGGYWTRPITSRSRIANSNDSVGIGTVSPTEWLDVNGNIRTRNNLLVDNDITATGDMIINNSTAILQLRNGSNVNTGFLQLSGNDLRLGTNSGNSTGNVIFRMNANNRVVINPAGDIDLDGKITRSAVTGTASLTPLFYGYIRDDGVILNGTGNFTVSRVAEGTYDITCSSLTIYSIILITTSGPDRVGGQFQLSSITTRVEIRSLSATGHPNRDDWFSIIAYKP